MELEEADLSDHAEPELRRPSRTWPLALTGAVLATSLLLAGALLCAGRLSPSGSGQARAARAVGLVESSSRDSQCRLIEDGVEYHTPTIRGSTMEGITTAEMCCAVCEADPACGAWTWGKKRGIVGLSDVCYLKDLTGGEEIVKLKRPEVVSGMPSRGVQKHGLVAAMRGQMGRSGGSEDLGVLPNQTCLGTLRVAGQGGGDFMVAALAGDERGRVELLQDSWVVPHLNGRAYFLERCMASNGQPAKYASISLLGKMLRYTTDVSGAGCGCNAAVRLVVPGGFTGDHSSEGYDYRIDIQGGNQYAWSTQIHVQGDNWGKSVGYGGGGIDWSGKRDWTGEEYGPGAACIDTSKAFEVAISFPVDSLGVLIAVEVTLSQFGRRCPLTVRIGRYSYEKRDGLLELSKALATGMTPMIKYDARNDNLWLDGIGTDGRGPCVKDVPEACPRTVRFYDFSIVEAGAEGQPAASVAGASFPASAFARESVEQAVHQILRREPPDADADGQREDVVAVAEVGQNTT